ncbi:MAG: protein-L-isoaspartate(D-aspartate) O-methyltransferase [Bryobacteraceae bacterium]
MAVIPDWPEERRRMVEKQLRRRGIHDPRVLQAMREIPREEFIPTESRLLAYLDDPVSIGYGQTISQPYMTALMAEVLELSGAETVLEVGAGCGYAAAVLGRLAAHVVAVEIVPALARVAEANLKRTHTGDNVEVRVGDGSMGYPERAPYDAISVAAAAPDVPPSLLSQLRDPGRLVIPVGPRHDQELRVVTKRDGRIDYRVATLCRFVPLRGGEGWQ